MASQFEHKLRPKAEEFIHSLQQSGLSGELLQYTLQEYSVKIVISQDDKGLGNAVIYYSPKKDSFRLTTNELKDKSIESALKDCWDGKHDIASEPPKSSTDISAMTEYHIYVDGSFLNEIVGYGAVVVKHNNIVGEISGKVEDIRMQRMHQVGGEITAVKKAVEWCHSNSVQEVDVFYDYEGVEKWVTGEWKSKNEFTQEYAQFVRKCGVKIHWHKVKSHSGDRWNDRADELAKLGSTPDTTDTSQPQDFEAELKAKALKFVEFLVNNEIQAKFDKIANSNCAKIKISHQHHDIGYFNLYHTPKKPFLPKYNEIQEKYGMDFQKRLERLWQEFIGEKLPIKQGILKPVKYYYTIFQPYKDCNFDFIDFARAIGNVSKMLGKAPIDIDRVRYDFVALENLYKELPENSHE